MDESVKWLHGNVIIVIWQEYQSHDNAIIIIWQEYQSHDNAIIVTWNGIVGTWQCYYSHMK